MPEQNSDPTIVFDAEQLAFIKGLSKSTGMSKEAIQTGILGYLTSPAFAPLRAAEMKGKMKPEGKKMPLTIRRPYLGPGVVALLSALAGGGLGAAAGGAIAPEGAKFLGVSGGAHTGAMTGASLGALIATLAQQRAVGRELGKTKAEDPELYRTMRKNVPKPKEDVGMAEKSSATNRVTSLNRVFDPGVGKPVSQEEAAKMDFVDPAKFRPQGKTKKEEKGMKEEGKKEQAATEKQSQAPKTAEAAFVQGFLKSAEFDGDVSMINPDDFQAYIQSLLTGNKTVKAAGVSEEAIPVIASAITLAKLGKKPEQK